MMRALFSGVTGLQSHQTRMDVIGNNIANVNTTGFKKSTTLFSDLYSQTISPSSAPTGNLGGTNAKQVGLGVSVAAIKMLHTPGAAQYTGASLDVAIEGEGFFTVRTPDGLRYTRAGSFDVASTGSFVDSNGYFVQCFGAGYQLGSTAYAKSTGFAGEKTEHFGDFVHKTMSDDGTTSLLSPSAQSGVYTFKAILQPDANGAGVAGTVKVFRNGVDLGIAVPITPDADGGMIDFNQAVGGVNLGLGQITFKTHTAGGAPTTAEDIAKEIENTVNFMQIEVTNDDGFSSNGIMGDLTIDPNLYYNVSIDESGAIVGQLRNEMPAEPGSNRPYMAAGEKVVLGYIAMATFANNAGLEKQGNNMYAASSNSGRASYNLAGSQGVGTLAPSSLEMSNVDLSEEMVNMIITQRGFQANSRIITTTDTMLEELVNLKR